MPQQYRLKKRVLFAILHVLKAVGGFRLARRVTAGDLRILTYHGAALQDEAEFRGGLFITRETFAQRMALLAHGKYPVLTLEEALTKLDDGSLPANATVITIDDGWWGTASIMAPILKHHGFPATLYVSSYYMQSQTQVFNVAVDYVLWRSTRETLDLALVDDALDGQYQLRVDGERAAATAALVTYGDSLDSALKRQELFRRVASVAGIDYQQIEDRRILAYMTASEARALEDSNIDVQLHTHRHRFPSSSFEELATEIEENRAALTDVAVTPLVHLCYPSGEYSKTQLPWLTRLGIRSATTVIPGFNTTRTPKFELRRFLDWDQITPIEFEAEMSGALELVRRCGYRI